MMRKPPLCAITPKRNASEALRLASVWLTIEFLHGRG
jgi:hypothetical protein